MPTALVLSSYEQADPGASAAVQAIRRALASWRVEAVGTEPVRGDGASRGARLRALVGADAAILTGSVFDAGQNERRGVRVSTALAVTSALQLRGRPRAVIGASAPLLRTARSRAMARALVHRAALLVLRDEESARALAAARAPAPFRIGGDPAWTELGEPLAWSRPERVNGHRPRTIAVTVLDADRLADSLVAAVTPMADLGFGIRLVPWTAGERDPRTAHAIAARLGGAALVAPVPRDLRDAAASLAESWATVALGYYPTVAAAGAGTPFVVLRREPGIAGIARRFGQRLVAPAAEPAELTAAIRVALAGEAPDADTVLEEAESAAEGLRLLRLLLSGGRSEDPSELEGLPLEPVPGR